MSIDFPCLVCRAKPSEPCVNTIRPGEPLPGRSEHFARSLPREERRQ